MRLWLRAPVLLGMLLVCASIHVHARDPIPIAGTYERRRSDLPALTMELRANGTGEYTFTTEVGAFTWELDAETVVVRYRHRSGAFDWQGVYERSNDDLILVRARFDNTAWADIEGGPDLYARLW